MDVERELDENVLILEAGGLETKGSLEIEEVDFWALLTFLW